MNILSRYRKSELGDFRHVMLLLLGIIAIFINAAPPVHAQTPPDCGSTVSPTNSDPSTDTTFTITTSNTGTADVTQIITTTPDTDWMLISASASGWTHTDLGSGEQKFDGGTLAAGGSLSISEEFKTGAYDGSTTAAPAAWNLIELDSGGNTVCQSSMSSTMTAPAPPPDPSQQPTTMNQAFVDRISLIIALVIGGWTVWQFRFRGKNT